MPDADSARRRDNPYAAPQADFDRTRDTRLLASLFYGALGGLFGSSLTRAWLMLAPDLDPWRIAVLLLLSAVVTGFFVLVIAHLAIVVHAATCNVESTEEEPAPHGDLG